MAKILVVDNDLDTLETIALSLEAGNYETIKVDGGQKALNLLKKKAVDLILLDIMMPEIDGIQVCKKLYKIQKLKKIPIILISALPIQSKNFKLALKETSALDNVKGAIEKPFQINDLLKRIDQILKS